jgi:type IV secretory pathway TrbD component
MNKNVGSIDRGLRIALGLALIALGVFLFDTWLISLMGLVLFLTGAVRICLLYKILGIDTCSQCSTGQNQ